MDNDNNSLDDIIPRLSRYLGYNMPDTALGDMAQAPRDSDPALDEVYQHYSTTINYLYRLFPDQHLDSTQRNTFEWILSATERAMNLDVRPALTPKTIPFDMGDTTYDALEILQARLDLRNKLITFGVALREHEFTKLYQDGTGIIPRLKTLLDNDALMDKQRSDYEAILCHFRRRSEALTKLSVATWASASVIAEHRDTPVVRKAHQLMEEAQEQTALGVEQFGMFQQELFPLRVELLRTQRRLKPSWPTAYRYEERSLSQVFRRLGVEGDSHTLSESLRRLGLDATTLSTNEFALAASRQLGLYGFQPPDDMNIEWSSPVNYQPQLYSHLKAIAEFSQLPDDAYGRRVAGLLTNVSDSLQLLEFVYSSPVNRFIDIYDKTVGSGDEATARHFMRYFELETPDQVSAWQDETARLYGDDIGGMFATMVRSGQGASDSIFDALHDMTSEQRALFGVSEERYDRIRLMLEGVIPETIAGREAVQESTDLYHWYWENGQIRFIHIPRWNPMESEGPQDQIDDEIRMPDDETGDIMDADTASPRFMALCELYQGMREHLLETIGLSSVPTHVKEDRYGTGDEGSRQTLMDRREAWRKDMEQAAVHRALTLDRDQYDTPLDSHDIVTGIGEIIAAADRLGATVTYRQLQSAADEMTGAMYPITAKEQLVAQGIDNFDETRQIELYAESEKRLMEIEGRLLRLHGAPAPYYGGYTPEQLLTRSLLDQIHSGDLVAYMPQDGKLCGPSSAAMEEVLVANENVKRTAREQFVRKYAPGRYIQLQDAFYKIRDVGYASTPLEYRQNYIFGHSAFDPRTQGLSMEALRQAHTALANVSGYLDYRDKAACALTTFLDSVTQLEQDLSSADVTDAMRNVIARRAIDISSFFTTRNTALPRFLLDQMGIEWLSDAEFMPAIADAFAPERITHTLIDTRGKAVTELALGDARYARQISLDDVKLAIGALRDMTASGLEYFEPNADGVDVALRSRATLGAINAHLSQPYTVFSAIWPRYDVSQIGSSMSTVMELLGDRFTDEGITADYIMDILAREQQQRLAAFIASEDEYDLTLTPISNVSEHRRNMITIAVQWEQERAAEVQEFVESALQSTSFRDTVATASGTRMDIVMKRAGYDFTSGMSSDDIRRFAVLNEAVHVQATLNRGKKSTPEVQPSPSDIKIVLPFGLYASSDISASALWKKSTVQEALSDMLHESTEVHRAVMQAEETMLARIFGSGNLQGSIDTEGSVFDFDMSGAMGMHAAMLIRAFGIDIFTSAAGLGSAQDVIQSSLTALLSAINRPIWEGGFNPADFGLDASSGRTYAYSELYAALIEYMKVSDIYLKEFWDNMGSVGDGGRRDSTWRDAIDLRRMAKQIQEITGETLQDISTEKLEEVIMTMALEGRNVGRDLPLLRNLLKAMHEGRLATVHAQAIQSVLETSRYVGIEQPTIDIYDIEQPMGAMEDVEPVDEYEAAVDEIWLSDEDLDEQQVSYKIDEMSSQLPSIESAEDAFMASKRLSAARIRYKKKEAKSYRVSRRSRTRRPDRIDADIQVTTIRGDGGSVTGFELHIPVSTPDLRAVLRGVHEGYIANYAQFDLFGVTQYIGDREIEITEAGTIVYKDTGDVMTDRIHDVKVSLKPSLVGGYPVVTSDPGEMRQSRFIAHQHPALGTELPIMRQVGVTPGLIRSTGHDDILGSVFEYVEPEMLIRTALRYAGPEGETVSMLVLDTETLGLATDVVMGRTIGQGVPPEAFSLLQFAMVEQVGLSGSPDVSSYIVEMSDEAAQYMRSVIELVEAGNIQELSEQQIIMLASLAQYARRYDLVSGDAARPFTREGGNIEAVKAGLQIFDPSDIEHAKIRRIIEESTRGVELPSGDTISVKDKVVSAKQAARILLDAVERNQLIAGQRFAYEAIVLDELFRRAKLPTDIRKLLRGKSLLDTLTLARLMCPDADAYRLIDLAKLYDIDISDPDQLHFAEVDTVLTANVLGKQLAGIDALLEDEAYIYSDSIQLPNLHAGDIVMAKIGSRSPTHENRIYAKSMYRLVNIGFGKPGEKDLALENKLGLGSQITIRLERLDAHGEPMDEYVDLETASYGAATQFFHEHFSVVRYQAEPGVFEGLTEEQVSELAHRNFIDRARRTYEKAAYENVLSSTVTMKSIDSRGFRTTRYLPGWDIQEVAVALAQQAAGQPIDESMQQRIDEIGLLPHEIEQLIALSPRLAQEQRLYGFLKRLFVQYTDYGFVSAKTAERKMHDLRAFLEQEVSTRETVMLPEQDYRVKLDIDVALPGSNMQAWDAFNIAIYDPVDIDRTVQISLWHLASELQEKANMTPDAARQEALRRMQDAMRTKGILDEEYDQRVAERAQKAVDEQRFDSFEAASHYYAGKEMNATLRQISKDFYRLYRARGKGQVLSEEEEARLTRYEQIVTVAEEMETMRPYTPEEMQRLVEAADQFIRGTATEYETRAAVITELEETVKNPSDLDSLMQTFALALRDLYAASDISTLTEDQQQLVLQFFGSRANLDAEVVKQMEEFDKLLGIDRQQLLEALGIYDAGKPMSAEQLPVNRSAWGKIRHVGRTVKNIASPFIIRGALHAMGAFINNAQLPYDRRGGDMAPATDGVFDPALPRPAYHQMLPRSYMASQQGAGYSGVQLKIRGTANSTMSKEQLEAIIQSAIGRSVPGPININLNVRDTSYKIDADWLDKRTAELLQ